MALYRNRLVVEAYKFENTIDFANKVLNILISKYLFNDDYDVKLKYTLSGGICAIIIKGYEFTHGDYIVFLKSYYDFQSEEDFFNNYEHIK